MASLLDGLPFTVERIYDTLSSDAGEGCILSRTRSPGLRRFRLTAENLELVAELAPILVVLETYPGSSLPFTLTLPDVGPVEVRNDDDGWIYEVQNGKLRSISVTLIEEP